MVAAIAPYEVTNCIPGEFGRKWMRNNLIHQFFYFNTVSNCAKVNLFVGFETVTDSGFVLVSNNHRRLR